MPATPERIQTLIDRQDIWDCLQRVSRGIDRFDKDSFLSAYHPDAIVDAGAIVGSPEQAYDNGAALHEEGQSGTLHNLLNHTCEIDGDVAHAETYFEYAGRNRDGSNWLAGGRYIDRLERRADEWRIAFRLTVMEWSGSMPGNEVPLFAGIDDVHLNGAPARDLSDPSYRRPLVNKRALRAPADPRALSRPKD